MNKSINVNDFMADRQGECSAKILIPSPQGRWLKNTHKHTHTHTHTVSHMWNLTYMKLEVLANSQRCNEQIFLLDIRWHAADQILITRLAIDSHVSEDSQRTRIASRQNVHKSCLSSTTVRKKKRTCWKILSHNYLLHWAILDIISSVILYHIFSQKKCSKEMERGRNKVRGGGGREGAEGESVDKTENH